MIDRLLLVEPSLFIQSQLVPFLKENGIKAYIAASARDATTLLTNVFPDVIIVELSLPDSDGLTFVKSLQTARPRTRIFIVSHSLDKGTLSELIQLGIKNIFIKPFSIERLLATIQASA